MSTRRLHASVQAETASQNTSDSDDGDASSNALSLSPTTTKPREIVGKSFFCLGPKNLLRRFAWSIVQHPYFDNTILLLIVLSSLSLVLDHP